MYVGVYACTPEWCSVHTGPNESHFELKCDWENLNDVIVKMHLLRYLVPAYLHFPWLCFCQLCTCVVHDEEKWIGLKIYYVCTKVKRSLANYFLSQNEEREEIFRGGTINDSAAEMQCFPSIFKQIPFVPSAACVQNRSSDCSTFVRCC